jgi:hypothetical protein
MCHALAIDLDCNEKLLFSILVRQGVTRVGILCSFSVLYFFVVWPGVVLNQRQLTFVVSD